LHEQYLKIFSIYFSSKKQGFFAKLLKTKKKVSTSEQKIAEDYYQKIENISQELINELDILERRILAISNEEIEKLF
jgi:GTP-dependent phosphoenolpyruvate carboxykinase